MTLAEPKSKDHKSHTGKINNGDEFLLLLCRLAALTNAVGETLALRRPAKSATFTLLTTVQCRLISISSFVLTPKAHNTVRSCSTR